MPRSLQRDNPASEKPSMHRRIGNHGGSCGSSKIRYLLRLRQDVSSHTAAGGAEQRANAAAPCAALPDLHQQRCQGLQVCGRGLVIAPGSRMPSRLAFDTPTERQRQESLAGYSAGQRGTDALPPARPRVFLSEQESKLEPRKVLHLRVVQRGPNLDAAGSAVWLRDQI